ncbi:MAG: hypothetical protein IJV96_00320 [Clostridia bacterium]|nr:hypothetical protein [Clostridia bacterium]
MRRRALVGAFLLALLWVLFIPVCAKGTESAAQNEAQKDPLTAAEDETREGLLALLPDAAKARLPDPTDAEAVEDAVGFRALFSLFADALTGSAGAHAGRLLSLVMLTLAFSVVPLFFARSSPVTATVLECSAALSVFALLYPTLARVLSFFSDLKGLSLGLSPIFVSLLAAGGGTAQAGAAGAGFSSFAAMLSLFGESVFPPLLRLLLALALLAALGNCTLVRELSRRLSGVTVFFFSVLSMLFLASLAFESSLAGSADSVALRTVKYTVSSAIPVVGSTVSGALSALSSSLSLLRGAAGGTAVVALLALLLPPLAEVFLLRLALSLCESVCVFTGADPMRGVLGRFRGVLDLALAALALLSVLFLVTVGTFSRAHAAL